MPVELRWALWTAAGNLRCWPRAREFSLKSIWPEHPWRDAGFGEELTKSPEMKARLLVKTHSRPLYSPSYNTFWFRLGHGEQKRTFECVYLYVPTVWLRWTMLKMMSYLHGSYG